MPVTHGVTGSSPVRTAINIDNQQFTNLAPSFTPDNVKLGILFYLRYLTYSVTLREELQFSNIIGIVQIVSLYSPFSR